MWAYVIMICLLSVIIGVCELPNWKFQILGQTSGIWK